MSMILVSDFWELVNDIDWTVRITKYEDLKDYIRKRYPDIIVRERIRVVFQVLQDILLDKMVEKGAELNPDLRNQVAHIIGLGKEEYRFALVRPLIAASATEYQDFFAEGLEE